MHATIGPWACHCSPWLLQLALESCLLSNRLHGRLPRCPPPTFWPEAELLPAILQLLGRGVGHVSAFYSPAQEGGGTGRGTDFRSQQICQGRMISSDDVSQHQTMIAAKTSCAQSKAILCFL